MYTMRLILLYKTYTIRVILSDLYHEIVWCIYIIYPMTHTIRLTMILIPKLYYKTYTIRLILSDLYYETYTIYKTIFETRTMRLILWDLYCTIRLWDLYYKTYSICVLSDLYYNTIRLWD